MPYSILATPEVPSASVALEVTGGPEGEALLVIRRDSTGVNVVREASEATVLWEPHPRVNLASNPSAEQAGPLVTVRTNHVPNPSFDQDAQGWQSYLTTLARDTARSTSGAASLRITAQASTSTDHTRGTAQEVTAPWAMAVAGGKTVTVSFDAYFPTGHPAESVSILPRDTPGGVSFSMSPLMPIAGRDGWHRYTYTFTIPADRTLTRLYLRCHLPAGQTSSTWQGGEEFWIDSVLVEEAGEARPYFDGSTPAEGDWTYGWSGTAHASTSRQQAPSVEGWSAIGATLVQRHDSDGDPYVQAIAQATGVGTYLNLYSPLDVFAEGDVGTVALDAWADVPGTAARLSMQYQGSSTVTHHGVATEMPADGSRVRLAITAPPAPAGTTRVRGLLYLWRTTGTSTPVQGQVLNVDRLMIEKGSTDGGYVAPGETVAVVTDYEATQGEQTDYLLADADGTVLDSVRVVLPRWGTWIKHPAKPHLNLRVAYVEDDGFTRDSRDEVLQIRGAKFPVVLSDRRLAPSGMVTVLTRTHADRLALGALLDDGGILMLDTDPAWGVPVRYVSVGSVTTLRPVASNLMLDRAARHHVLPLQAVAAPIGLPVGQGATYTAIPARFGSYAALAASVDTYENVRLSV